MASTEDGQDLSAGQTNIAQSGTELRCDEAELRDGSDFILQVRHGALSARVGAIRAIAARFGVSGQAAGGEGGGTGVLGSGHNGVEGQGDLTGVAGTGGQNGVLGQGRVGVFGQGSILGVQGGGIPGGTAAIGVSGSGNTGVSGSGVIGVEGGGTNAERGFLGGKDPQFGESAGVYGESAAQGVMGLTTDHRGTGVYGGGKTAAGGGYIGVRGESFGFGGIGVRADTTNGGIALWADAGDPNNRGIAGAFFGDLHVFGLKSAAVPHPDGSHRLLYCVESPESWFEDFGEAQLVDGKVEVRLDPDFAALVEVDGYHVFITPYGESKGLFVAKRYATGFRVCEQQDGTNNVSFAYRVVAKRKDIVADRLAKMMRPGARGKPADSTGAKPPVPSVHSG